MNDYDKDNDGRLDPQELLSWVVPNNQGIAQEEVSVIELCLPLPNTHFVSLMGKEAGNLQ